MLVPNLTLWRGKNILQILYRLCWELNLKELTNDVPPVTIVPVGIELVEGIVPFVT